jgi:hypothetical protein
MLSARTDMGPAMTLRVQKLASFVCEGASAALWLLVGLWSVRLLIKLARMVPVRSRAQTPSRN